MSGRLAAAMVVLTAAPLAAGCGGQRSATSVVGRAATGGAAIRALVREARPIGTGRRFHEPAHGPVTACRRGLGRRFPVHVELFAADRVVLIPPGIGVAGPTRRSDGRIVAARCFGPIVTLDATGVALVRPGRSTTLGQLFDGWGQPLSATRLAAFTDSADGTVRVYVDGRRQRSSPPALRLTADAEIVLEVGPEVPPHHRYVFGPLPG